jgi:hypothetical protein
MTNTLTYLPGYLNVYQYALLALFGGAANVAAWGGRGTSFGSLLAHCRRQAWTAVFYNSRLISHLWQFWRLISLGHDGTVLVL